MPKNVLYAEKQKWWYEFAKGSIGSTAVKCKGCRNKDKERKAIARRIHLEGIENKKKLKNT